MKARLLILLLLALPLLGIFAPALTGRSSFAFRDAAFYYHPMFEYARQEWGAGRIPLWNPYENLGVPLVAENTSSVFYPGKLLFVLPLDYTLLYNWYVVAHVALAAWASYRLARHFGASGQGAALAALSYAFCGNVVFQVCNVVFLVGAAWLPLALLAADRMLRERAAASAVGLGTVLALMVLGGDPQLAYTVVVVVALYGVLLWWNERGTKSEAASATSASEAPPIAGRGWLAWRPMLLGVSLAVAGLLAAVQVLPTLEASPHSGRSRYDSPRNIYELASTIATRPATDNRLAWYDGLLGSVHRRHTGQIYAFSVPPWRLGELLWPNVSGAPFPTQRRWFNLLLPEGNLWAGSLYMGLLPFLLAINTWTVRRAPVEQRYLSWLVLFGVLGSFGVYGVAWLVGSIFGGADLLNIGGEVGGVYWWLTVLLPSYVSFRYPAKLFVLASVALSMLAARGWDDVWVGRKRRRFYVLVGIAILSLAIMPFVSALWERLAYLDERVSPSILLGPTDWAGVWHDVVAGSLHTCILATLLAAGLLLGWRRVGARPALQVAALVLTVVDLLIAQTPLVLYASTELMTARPKVLDLLGDDFREWRIFRQLNVLPPEWEVTISEERYNECLAWDRETLWPKYPLPYHVPLAEASQTIAAEDYQIVLDIARQHSARNNRGGLPPLQVLDLISARLAIVMENSAEGLTSKHTLPLGMRLGTRPTAIPRAWIARRVESIAPPASLAPFVVQSFTQSLFFPDNQARDWHSGSVVEGVEPIALPARDEAMAQSESCHIVAAEPQRVEIDVRLAAPGLVVLGDLFYPGWEATLETAGDVRPLEILRTNRVMRGVVVPAGTHRIVYRYRPRSVLVGGILSAISALALVGLAIVSAKRRGFFQKAVRSENSDRASLRSRPES